MRWTWRVSLVASVMTGVLMIAGCAPSPGQPGSASPAPSTPSASPAIPLGPNLTTAQFSALIAAGKLGDRSFKLEKFDKGHEGDPDNEASENQQQNQAKSCVKMNQLADSRVVAQAADSGGTAIVQLYNNAETVVELFGLNQKCAAEEAKLDAGTAVTPIDGGQDGSALWWLIKDPGGVYQGIIAYGNVIVYLLLDGPDKPLSLVQAVHVQLDQLAKK